MSLDAIYGDIRSLWVVWLMMLFVAIIVWAYWPRNRSRLEDHASIPLRDDDPIETDRRPDAKGND